MLSTDLAVLQVLSYFQVMLPFLVSVDLAYVAGSVRIVQRDLSAIVLGSMGQGTLSQSHVGLWFTTKLHRETSLSLYNFLFGIISFPNSLPSIYFYI